MIVIDDLMADALSNMTQDNIAALVAAAGPTRVAPVDHGGRRYWLKRVTPAKATIWHRGQGAVARTVLRRWPVLLPTASAGGAAALRAEAARLSDFAARGVYVPDVVALADDYVLLADAGAQLKDVLDALPPTGTARVDLIAAAATALARLHAAGLCHGRPQLKDMVRGAGGRIGFLDLEEDPVAVMPLAQAQARDAWLFMGAAARYGASDDTAFWAAVWGAYERAAPVTTREALAQLVRGLRWARAVVAPIAPHAGKDVRQAVTAQVVLERVLM